MNIFFCVKWSKLEYHLKTRPEIEWYKQDGNHSITGHKYVRKLNGSGIEMSGFGMVTVIVTGYRSWYHLKTRQKFVCYSKAYGIWIPTYNGSW